MSIRSAKPYVVYVEGARDGEILRGWARGLSPPLSRALAGALVILGGRQPERARQHLDELRRSRPETRGLCVFDRDDQELRLPEREGLQSFSWGRRHIESYLLAPDPIRRALRLGPTETARLERLIRAHAPAPGDETALERLDAKRLLGPKGPIARKLGRNLPSGRIARATRPEELHSDVSVLLGRVGNGLGFSLSGPQVEIRAIR
ncbi:MAG: hypothetical protein GY723_08375 [bacterium]|nr:hypothetical protein [bacterium]